MNIPSFKTFFALLLILLTTKATDSLPNALSESVFYDTNTCPTRSLIEVKGAFNDINMVPSPTDQDHPEIYTAYDKRDLKDDNDDGFPAHDVKEWNFGELEFSDSDDFSYYSYKDNDDSDNDSIEMNSEDEREYVKFLKGLFEEDS